MILGAMAVAGCAVSSRVVMAPDGYAALMIRCHGVERCMNYASRKCPTGYQVLDQQAQPGFATYTQVGNTMVATHHERDSMLIRCAGGTVPYAGQ